MHSVNEHCRFFDSFLLHQNDLRFWAGTSSLVSPELSESPSDGLAGHGSGTGGGIRAVYVDSGSIGLQPLAGCECLFLCLPTEAIHPVRKYQFLRLSRGQEDVADGPVGSYDGRSESLYALDSSKTVSLRQPGLDGEMDSSLESYG